MCRPLLWRGSHPHYSKVVIVSRAHNCVFWAILDLEFFLFLAFGCIWFLSNSVTGTDTIVDYERVEFNDGTLRLDVGTHGLTGQIYRMYKAALDRAPDAAGLAHQLLQVEGNGLSLHDVAKNIISSSEFTNMYGSNISEDNFVSILYQNSLDRLPSQDRR